MSEKLSTFVQRSAVPFFIVIGLMAVGGVGYHLMNSKTAQTTEKLANELFAIKKEYRTATETLQKNLPQPTADKKLEPPQPKKEELQKAYAPIVEKLDVFIKANQGQMVTVEAGLLAADMLAGYENWSRGAEILQSSLNGYNDTQHFLYGMGHAQLGTFYIMQEKCTEAVQAWEKGMTVKSVSFLKPQLRLKLGLCYEKMSQLDRAEKMYQDVINDMPKSLSARTAKKFLFNLKLMKAKGSEASAGTSAKND